MASRVVCVGHISRTGKDTFSKYLSDYLNAKGVLTERYKLSTPLKEITAQMYGSIGLRDGDYYEDNPDKRYELLPELGQSPVQIWINVGRILNEYDPRVFVRPAVDFIRRSRADVVVISDLRRHMEVRTLREAFSTTFVRCDRAGHRPISPVDAELCNYYAWDRVAGPKLSDLERTARDLGREMAEEFSCRGV